MQHVAHWTEELRERLSPVVAGIHASLDSTVHPGVNAGDNPGFGTTSQLVEAMNQVREEGGHHVAAKFGALSLPWVLRGHYIAVYCHIRRSMCTLRDGAQVTLQWNYPQNCGGRKGIRCKNRMVWKSDGSSLLSTRRSYSERRDIYGRSPLSGFTMACHLPYPALCLRMGGGRTRWPWL